MSKLKAAITRGPVNESGDYLRDLWKIPDYINLAQNTAPEVPLIMPFTSLEPAQEIEIRPITSTQTPGFDVRFFLTEPELKEAVTRRKSFWRSTEGKILTKVITGFGAIYFPLFPYLHGMTWPEFLAVSPIKATYLAAAAVLDIWVATGSLGIQHLNRIANRLELERRVILSDDGVVVLHGTKRRQFRWNQLRGFQETENLFLLLTGEHTFWTIPKRTVGSDVSRLQSFLLTKTRQK